MTATTSRHSSIKRLLIFVHHLEEKLSSVKSINDQLYELIKIVSKTHESIVDELTTIKTVLNETTKNQEDDDEMIPVDGSKSEWDNDDDEEEQTEEPQLSPTSSSATKFESKSVTNLGTAASPSNPTADRISLCSASSCGSSTMSSSISSTLENRPSSSTSKRSSNLKKSDQPSRAKSPKSVTFVFDEQNNKSSTDDKQRPPLEFVEKQKPPIGPIERAPTEPKNQPFGELTAPLLPPALISRQHSDLIPDLFKQHYSEVTNKSTIGFKMGNALTCVRIHEIESTNGDYLRLLNVSNSDDYDLGGHFLQQNVACVPVCRFRFPFNTIIRAGQTVTVWCGALRDIEPQPPHVFVWKEQRRWETGPECVTILAKPSGQAIAWTRSSYRVNSSQSSSDILFVHSKCNTDTASISSVSVKSRSLTGVNPSRLSAFSFVGNSKPPFAHSPNNPVHPDHNGGLSSAPKDLRSQMHQRNDFTYLLKRPKSSPFASHTGCKQDLISMQFLRQQQLQGQKQTTVKA